MQTVQQPLPQSFATAHSNCVQCHRTLTDASHPWCTKACRNAYNTAATARGEVCQQCNQKAKHPDHPFCGNDCREQYKTSAAARGDLCTNCNKRVKKPGYDFCSRTCGSQAAAAATALQANQVQAVQAQMPTTFGAPVANAVRQGPAVQGGNAGRSSRPTRQHAANATAGQPTTLAQLPTMNAGANATGANVVQPASISTWAANVNNAQGGRPLPAPTPQNTMMPPAAKGPYPAPQNKVQVPNRNGKVPYATAPPAVQFAPSPSPSPAPAATGLSAAFKKVMNIGQPSPDDDDTDDDVTDAVTNAIAATSTKCLLDNCMKPVHQSPDGTTSQFCSRRHARDSVKLGLKAGCILCNELPQDDSHYFCGSKCIVKSMSKSPGGQ